LLIAGLLAAATPSAGPGSGLQAMAAGDITFGNPTISGIQGTGFEQDIRIDSRGRIYTSAPGTLSSGTSYLYRSLDRGQTFKWVPAAVQPQGKLPTCPGGGDTELATDPAGNLYFNDLTLANFSTARSSDQGRTFLASCAGVAVTPVDRQWYAVDGNPMNAGSITLTFDLVPNPTPVPNPNCAVSNDLVFARSLPGASAGLEFAPVQVLATRCDEGIMGNDEVFNYGGLKRAFVIHDNDSLNQIRMARCDLVDFTVSATGYTNCVDTLISSFPNARTGGNFSTLAIDRAGNLFTVWEQAPYKPATAVVTGDTLLYYSWSKDQGNSWASPQVLPTPGLFTNVFAWPAAGDAGRVDVAFYGTPAHQACPPCQGPDSTKGDWSLYLAQSLNFMNPTAWGQPVLAGEHFVHRGTVQTLIGGQSGDRTLGDFLQVRIGAQGEANITYADSNSDDEFVSQAAYIRQNGGPSVFSAVGTVNGIAERFNSVQVGPHPATLDSAGVSSTNQPNLTVLGSQVSMPNTTTYQIKMLVGDLTSLSPKPDAGGTVLVWNTQWKVLSGTDGNGGAYFHAYMESVAGGSPTFWVGQNALQLNGGGATATYPGSTQVTGSYSATAPGLITITVPTSAVSEANPIGNLLYSVTSSSMTLAVAAESVPNLGGVGGVPFNLVDVAPAYDFNPALPTPPFQTCHEGDGDGTFQGKGGTARFHFDEDTCEDSGAESVSESDPGSANFQSTQITGVTFDDLANTVTLAGSGTDNGNPVSFTFVGSGASPGVPVTLTLILSDGYVISAPLLSGGIQLQ
jgi:hypothetical protein